MTLYNKDGSIYKLSAPNPVMKDQEIWSEFVVHNMKWNPEFQEDGSTTVLPVESDFEINRNSSFLDELDIAKKEVESSEKAEKEAVKMASDIEEPVLPIKKEPKKEAHNFSSSSSTIDIKKTFTYCLPAVIREKQDSLYGDVYKTIQYESPTSFESVIISQNDMFLELWSETFFREGSILYPKNGDKRWWKIQSFEPKLGGWLMRAAPSQDQPSFE